MQSAGSDEAPAAQALSKEEEARLQAQREAAIREAMDREAQDFISHVGEDEEGEVGRMPWWSTRRFLRGIADS